MSPAEWLTSIAVALRTLLPEQRWFAGKGLPVHGVSPVRATVLGGTDPQLLHAVVEVDQGVARRDRYQFLLGVRSELPDSLGHAWVAASGDRVVYQAIHDPELTGWLLSLMAAGAEVDGLRFGTEPGVTLDTGLRSRPVGGEQSNTSLVYGQTYILKLFRKLDTGLSPDLELHRALAAVGCKHIATPLGSIEGALDSGVASYGMLTEYLRGTADGWAMATASVRDLLAENQLAEGADGPVDPGDVGGDFASESHRLGHAVATVHADLATALGSSAGPSGYLPAVADRMHRKLDATLAQVPDLAPYESALRMAFDEVRDHPGPVPIQRVHGDLHLGQVLRSVTGWILIDFEGEPMAPLAERIAPASVLHDVAGMLRSFDYAAHHLPLGDADPQHRATVALEWVTRNQEAFCDGYAQVGADPREQAVLLRAFELEKAVYEVSYEHHNRPSWLPIPLTAIARRTDQISHQP
ncbi:MAG TPA: aminoglycoside phosphotransferase [Pseudonocardiaceae bacterium]|jgi:maltokinase|nr:aminoglycoside phosphotransferase [Pseudonocardiaceae bacterium]